MEVQHYLIALIWPELDKLECRRTWLAITLSGVRPASTSWGVVCQLIASFGNTATVKIPETIQSHYPTMTLEQVNGAIAFYLNHKEEVEQVMEERRRAEHAYIAAHPTPPDIKAKFERMRRQMASRRS